MKIYLKGNLSVHAKKWKLCTVKIEYQWKRLKDKLYIVLYHRKSSVKICEEK